MAVNTILNYSCELTHGVVKTNMRPALLSGDQHAHKIMVAVTQDNANVSLSGCAVKGYFLRPDGATVVIDGAANGNYAVVTLPADCYALPGLFSLVIRVSIGTVINTVFWGEGMVGRSTSDIVVDPGEVLPSLDSMLALVERAEAAAQAIGAAAPAITCNAAGEIVAVQDAANRAPRVLNLYGKTTQAATPTPSAPQDMASKSGAAVKVCGKNIFDVFGDNINIGRNGTEQGSNKSVVNADGSITVNVSASSTYGMGFLKRLPAGITVSVSFDVLSVGNGTSVGFVVWETPNIKQHISDRIAVGHYTAQFTVLNDGLYMCGWMVRDGSNPCGAIVTNVQLEIGGVATAFEPYINAGAVTITNGLHGIPVTADGNHTDASGQHWVADYVDIPGKGMYNVLDSFTLDGSEGYAWTIGTGSGLTVAYVGPQDKWSAHDAALADDTRLMSTHFVGGLMTEVGRIKLDANFLNLSVPDSITTSDEMNAWLAANPVTVLYVRETPVYTALALDDITLPNLHATAYNDSGCSMHLAYDADTKAYVDNKIAAITAAVLATGANV